MSFVIVDQENLMLGDEDGPFLFRTYAQATSAAARAQLRIGGRFRYSVTLYEGHTRIRDYIDIPALPTPDWDPPR